MVNGMVHKTLTKSRIAKHAQTQTKQLLSVCFFMCHEVAILTGFKNTARLIPCERLISRMGPLVLLEAAALSGRKLATRRFARKRPLTRVRQFVHFEAALVCRRISAARLIACEGSHARVLQFVRV